MHRFNALDAVSGTRPAWTTLPVQGKRT